jgi:hypothetical protein
LELAVRRGTPVAEILEAIGDDTGLLTNRARLDAIELSVRDEQRRSRGEYVPPRRLGPSVWNPWQAR